MVINVNIISDYVSGERYTAQINPNLGLHIV